MPHRPKSSTTNTIGLRERVAIEELRAANDRLSQQLMREKARTERFHTVIERAISDSLNSLTIPPVPQPAKQRSKRNTDEEKAIIVLSDLQLAKVTPTYNSTVAKERVDRFARKVQQLTAIARHDHPVREARVYILGDIVEGELIFPHQPFQIDASIIEQVKHGAEITANFLRNLLADFDKVHVVCVIGNHGALVGGRGSRYNPETNMDRMLYLFAKEILRGEKRCTWHIPWEKNERSWYAVDRPFSGGKGFFLFHGDQIPGSANHSVATIAKHIYGWASGAIPEPFEYAIYGHYHTPRRFRLNRFVAWCNGSVESSNTYAQEKLAAVGVPEQLLLFIHARRGVTSEYWVQLNED